MSRLRVLAFGSWDRGAGYPRADALLNALRRRDVSVAEFHFDLPGRGADKRRLLQSPWRWPGLWWTHRAVRRRVQSEFRAVIQSGRPDVVLVPYPGHHIVHWLASVWSGPIVLDLFLSAYDTAVTDRAMFRSGSLVGRYLHRLDRRACEAADVSLLDTAENVRFAADLTGLPESRFAAVPVSDPDEPERPLAYAGPAAGAQLELLFFGTGVPLHGLSILLDAVDRCQGVRLTMIGGDPTDRRRAARMAPDKVALLDEFVGADELRRRLQVAHLVAGIFGASDKADRVIPFKLMQSLAVGRPVISARTRATTSMLVEGEACVLVPPGDSRALAAALQDLQQAPARLASLAAGARPAYDRSFSLDRVGDVLLATLIGLGIDCGEPVVVPEERVVLATTAAST